MSGQSIPHAIDVHTHFVPTRLASRPVGAAENLWPSMCPGQSCRHRHVMISGKVYRKIDDRCWSAPQRIADMESMSVTRQVLSPMPELLSYWLPAQDAKVLLRDINEQMAELAGDYPDHFLALAGVPLQDVELAIEEMEYAARDLGLSGVEIGSNVNGKPIGAPELEPFFAAAARLNMAVFVHAIRPAGMERLVGPASLQQALGFPGEIGLAAASAITSNLLLHHPSLRIAFSHGGGSLAMLLPRLQHAWQVFPALNEAIQTSPWQQARRMFYDTLVYDGATLRHLVDCLGADNLMLGTDYPFQILEPDPLGRLSVAGLDQETATRLRQDNAARFLALHNKT